jgi:protein-S-isoprenylcysteine O-methyltransferase Ste14
MTKTLFFILISCFLVYISRSSLGKPESHGFYRFFAWEFIAILFVINFEYWNSNPLAWYQIISWVLLFISLVPLTFGIHSLIKHGKPTSQRVDEPQLLAFEKTTELVTTGIYHWIRHPLYSSLLFLTWGIFFKTPSMVGGIISIAASLLLISTANADEAECIRYFGSDYLIYRKNTKRFIPFIF